MDIKTIGYQASGISLKNLNTVNLPSSSVVLFDKQFAINSKLRAMYIDKLAHGSASNVPFSGIKLHNLLDELTKAENRIK